MRHCIFLFSLMVSVFAFSQDKCVDLFSVSSEVQIQTKIDALVLLNFQIEQNLFENPNQLKQAQENFAKQLKEVIKIDPNHLADFKKLQAEKNKELKTQAAAENKKRKEVKRQEVEKIENYEAFVPEEKFVIWHDGYVNSAKFSPNDKFVATASNSHESKIYEVDTGKEMFVITHYMNVNKVDFSSDSKYVVTVSDDSLMKVYEVATGLEKFKTELGGPGRDVSFSADGKYVIANCGNGSRNRIYDVGTWQENITNPPTHKVSDSNLSPNARYVIKNLYSHTVSVVEVATGLTKFEIPHDAFIRTAAFSKDNKFVATASSDHKVKIYELSTGKEIAEISHKDPATAVSFSNDSSRLITISNANVAVYELYHPLVKQKDKK